MIIRNKTRKGFYPLEIQSTANLGIYGEEYLTTMKQDIKSIIDKGNQIQADIMTKRKKETVESIIISIN